MLDRPDRGRGREQRERERQAEPVHGRDREIAADHREGAMGEVDEAHQAHRDRQADRDHEQHHAVGKTIEQDADQDLHRLAGGAGAGARRPPQLTGRSGRS